MADFAAGRSILVVEDEPSISESLAKLIRKVGGEPIVISDGEKAYELFLQKQPDLCIVDILLPGLNGLELTRRIKAKSTGTKVPVILISAVYRGKREIEQNRRNAGADAYLSKPFSGDQLIDALRKHLPRDGGSGTDSALLSGSTTQLVRDDDPVAGVPLEGRFNEVELGSVLLRLFLEKRTGTLTVQSASVRREVYFIEGYPVFARANTLAESLGTLLIRRGLADLQQINEVLQSRSGNRTMGQQLIEAGVISTDDLMDTLGEQVRERVIACFNLTEGSYAFAEGTGFVDHIQVYQQNPIALIRMGVEKNLQVNALAERMQTLVDKHVVRSQRFDSLMKLFPANEADKRFIALMDGKTTVTRLLQQQLLDVTKALQLVWAMKLAGLIDFSDKALASESRPQIKVPGTSSPEIVARTESDSDDQGLSDTEELRAAVMDKYVMLGKANSYQLLGIERSATQETIETVTATLLEMFNWDRTSGLSPEDRIKANEVYAAILTAQRVLADPRQRAEYDRGLTRQNLVGVTNEYRLNRGALAYGAARKLIAAERYERAMEQLELAAQHNPDDPNVLADTAWVSYKIPGGNRKREEVRKALNNVLVEAPRNTRVRYYLGVIESDSGNVDMALEHLRTILDLHPDHEEARALHDTLAPAEESPDAGPDGQTSVWAKLFGDS